MMKKIVSWLFVFICFSLLSACGSQTQTSNFEKGTEEGFSVYSREGIEIRISNKLEDEEVLFEHLSKLLSSLEAIHPIKQLKIVVSDKVSKSNFDYEVKVHADSIYKDYFVKEVLARSYGLYDNWMIEGLYGVVLTRLDETTPYYEKEAAEIYAGSYFPEFFKGMEFSLFGARFFEELYGTDEVTNLKQASRSLVDYLIKQGLFENLLKGDLEWKDILAWAEENEIDLSYYKEIYESTKGLRVSKPDLGYLQIESGKDISGFTIHIVSEGQDYDSAHKIEAMIQGFEEGIEENLAVIKAEAPQFFEDYKIALTEVPRISYHIDKFAPTNYRERNEITLRNLPAHIVEYNHLLFDESFKRNRVTVDRSQWLTEGLDAYMGTVLVRSGEDIIGTMTVASLAPITEMERQKYSPRDLELWTLQQDLIRANFTEEELSDVGLLLQKKENKIKLHHIFNAAYFNYSDLIPQSMADVNNLIAHNSLTPSEDDTVDTVDRARGQSFFTNHSFTAFLIETYGLEKLLYLGLADQSKMTYKEYFGKSYDELVEDWKSYVSGLIQSADRIFNAEEGN